MQYLPGFTVQCINPLCEARGQWMRADITVPTPTTVTAPVAATTSATSLRRSARASACAPAPSPHARPSVRARDNGCPHSAAEASGTLASLTV